jgi:hypothetical protein
MGAMLSGLASRSMVGTKIYLASVTAQHVPKGAHAFKVFVAGHMPALKLIGKAALYRYSPPSATWRRVAAVTGSGIYAAAPR